MDGSARAFIISCVLSIPDSPLPPTHDNPLAPLTVTEFCQLLVVLLVVVDVVPYLYSFLPVQT